MKKHIELQTQTVEYTLKLSSRARRMRLAFCGDGTLVVTAPATMRERMVEHFIVSKSGWILKQLSRFNTISRKMTACEPAVTFQQGKEAALAFVHGRLKLLNAHYGFAYRKVAIRNQKTRWGSCSKKGNLNFNYRIASIPLHLADYVIVHELCHLTEFNHSEKFWNLVAMVIPNHRELRKDLRWVKHEKV